MNDVVFLDGKFLPRGEARVSIEDRGYQFADGAYEVIRFHGRRGIRLRQHLERMERSLGHLRIVGAPTLNEWLAIIEELQDRCAIPDDPSHVTILYQQVTRGVAPRNHVFPASCKPVATLNFRMAPAYSKQQRENGVALSCQPDERWNRCYIKAVNLLPVVLAKQAAVDAGAFEALLVRNGFVTEGGATNAYCVIGGTIFTHPEGPHILSGVVREMVLEAAQKAGIPLRETPVLLEDFRKADEVFISSTTMDIMPVTRLDGDVVGNGTPGPVTRRLMEVLAGIIAEEIQIPATVTT
jgi:D-alanine transaminase